MFISQIMKNPTTNKRFMLTFLFERARLLWEFEDDDENQVTKVTKLVEKIILFNDGRLPSYPETLYLRLSKAEYEHIISELGLSFYGDFTLHTTLKYKKLTFADGVFAEETTVLPTFNEITMEEE